MTDASKREMDNDEGDDEENNACNPTINVDDNPTTEDSIFPVDFTENNVFTSHPDTGSSGSDAANFQAGEDVFMPFSDSDSDSEAVEVAFAWVDSMEKSEPSSSSSSSSDDDSDDDESKTTAEESAKRSILHSRGCTFVMAALIIGSIAFIVTIFALHPGRGEVDAAADTSYTDTLTSNNDETVGGQFQTNNEDEGV